MTDRTNTVILLRAALLTPLLACPTFAGELEPILASGLPAPLPTSGVSDASPIQGVSTPSINAHGDIVFSWWVLDFPGLVYPSTLAVLDADGGLRAVASRGTGVDNVEGAGITVEFGFQDLAIDDRGHAFAHASAGGPGLSFRAGLLRENEAGGVDLVGVTRGPNDQLPAGVELDAPGSLVRLGGSGVFAWSGELHPEVDPGGATDRALFAGFGDAPPRLLALTGAQAPGQEAGVTVRSLPSDRGSFDIGVSDNGLVSFGLSAQDEAIGFESARSVLYRAADADTLEVIAQTDRPVSMPDGPAFRLTTRFDHAIGDAGQLLFNAVLDEDGPAGDQSTPLERLALVLDDPTDGPRVLARHGTPVTSQPGSGKLFTYFYDEGLELAGDDTGIFYARAGTPEQELFNGDDHALFYFDPLTEPTAIASRGDSAPGFDDDVLIDFAINDPNNHVNDAGSVVFQTMLSNGIEAWYAWTPECGLELIVAEGQLVDADPDPFGVDLRLVTEIEVADRALSDTNRFTFLLRFENNARAVFVTTVPSPHALALAVLVGGWGAGRRRRR